MKSGILSGLAARLGRAEFLGLGASASTFAPPPRQRFGGKRYSVSRPRPGRLIAPPPAKAARIAAGRAKLMAKAARARARAKLARELAPRKRRKSLELGV